jgi:hypothetical protein
VVNFERALAFRGRLLFCAKEHPRACFWLAWSRGSLRRDLRQLLALLNRQKDAIERELGYPLEWEELPGDQRIASFLKEVDPKDQKDWPRQHEWLATRLNNMHRIFAPRVAALDVDTSQLEAEEVSSGAP